MKLLRGSPSSFRTVHQNQSTSILLASRLSPQHKSPPPPPPPPLINTPPNIPIPKVLQCIEEAHVLEGHTGDNIGDGTPKLPWQAYCDALDAIARCTSVGRHRGTRPR